MTFAERVSHALDKVPHTHERCHAYSDEDGTEFRCWCDREARIAALVAQAIERVTQREDFLSDLDVELERGKALRVLEGGSA